MNVGYNWRYTFIGLIFALVGVAIIGQLVRIQVFLDPEEFIDPKTMGEPEQAASRRGLIYDRNGKLLATNTTVYDVEVSILDIVRAAELRDDVKIEEINRIFEVAIEVFKITDESTLELLRTFPYPKKDSIRVAQYAPRETVELFLERVDYIQVRDNEDDEDKEETPAVKENAQDPSIDLLNCHIYTGIYCEPRFMRVYPEETLAANVLGMVRRDDGRGRFGVEGEYDTTLIGDDRIVKALWNPHKADQSPYPEHGANLILTIDSLLQAEVEEILDEALVDNGGQAGVIIVMDPQTGEIYAMASAPRVDPNEYYREDYIELVNNKDNIFNYAIKAYEPGSVVKILTMAAALDAGVVERDTVYIDTGKFNIGGVTIRNWDGQAWGPQTMTQCLENSLNVCLAWIGSQLGVDKFYEYFQNFGFGQLTGVGLANEAPGKVRSHLDENWHKSDLGTNSFGQGISITPIQMLRAVSAIANDGEMVIPRIVHGIVEDGEYYEAPVISAGHPISPETAQTLSSMLAQSIKGESYQAALVPGYKLAGKTGTAEIYVQGEGYTSDLTDASFIGWGPVDDPRFMVYVWIHKPLKSPWGSTIASPIFRHVVERVVIRLDIPPDGLRHSLQEDI